MLRITFYEIKKMWSYKYLIFVAIICLAVTLFPILRTYAVNKSYVNAERNFYSKYGGELTEKKHSEILKIANSDNIFKYDQDGNMVSVDIRYMVANSALEDIEYMVGYKSMNNKILSQARENISFYNKTGYTYLTRVNGQIIKKYSNDVQPWLISTNSWNSVLTDFYYTMPALLLIMILVSSIFTRENESRMDVIIRSSYVGAGRLFICKIIAAALSAFGVMLVFAAVNYLAHAFTSCMYGAGAVLRSVPEFAYSPVNISLWQAMVLFALLASTAAMLFGVLFAVISSLCKRSFVSIVAAFVMLVVGYIDYYFIDIFGNTLFNIDIDSPSVVESLIGIRKFAFSMLLNPGAYFDNYYTVSVFSHPVSSVLSSLVIGFVVISAGILLSYIVYTRVLKNKG